MCNILPSSPTIIFTPDSHLNNGSPDWNQLCHLQKQWLWVFQTTNYINKSHGLQNSNFKFKLFSTCRQKISLSYLLKRPLSFKKLKVTFNHLKFNVTFFPRGKILKILLIAIQNSFGIEFKPKWQILLSNLLKECTIRVNSKIKDKSN